MASIKIKLERTELAEEGLLEASGSLDWIKAITPLLTYVIGAVVRAHGIAPGKMARAANELNEAFYAATRGEDYHGEIVSITIRDQAKT